MRLILAILSLMTISFSASESWASTSSVTPGCLDFYSQSELLLRKSWQPLHFTNPTFHNSSDFKYIVRVQDDLLDYELREVIDRLKTMRNKQIFSASVISNDFLEVYKHSKWALILKVPENRIVASHFEDMRTGDVQKSDSSFYRLKFGLQTPNELIENSLSKRGRKSILHIDMTWNEVLVDNSTATSLETVSISGIAIFKSKLSPSRDLDALINRLIKEIAIKLQIPIVEI